MGEWFREIFYCKRHDCKREHRELERGKTELYCPKCEDETFDRLAALFDGVTVENYSDR